MNYYVHLFEKYWIIAQVIVSCVRYILNTGSVKRTCVNFNLVHFPKEGLEGRQTQIFLRRLDSIIVFHDLFKKAG